jgi:hypothetical protein
MAAGPAALSGFHFQQHFAGNTSPNTDQRGLPAPPTVGEGLSTAGILSDLDVLVAGGIHPEMGVLTVPAGRALQQASDSVRGIVGGLRPRPNSILSPGPAGEGAAARVRQTLSRLGL